MSGHSFVGIDCGGSATRAVWVDADGKTLGSGQAGSGNLATTPDRILRENLRKATAGFKNASAVCGCFAGLLTASDHGRAASLLAGLFPVSGIRVEPDFAAAFYACDPLADVCVIAGTGSSICSLRAGELVRSGGGGYLLGDEGSAFQLGRDALRHFLDDDTRPSERLRNAVLGVFRTDSKAEVIASLYRSATPPAKLAKLAKVLSEEAAAGEHYALKSVSENMSALAERTAAHIKREVLTDAAVRVTLAGGVWRIRGMQVAFEEALTLAMPTKPLSVEALRRAPVGGAVVLAREMLIGN